jgi:hypothetical protein
MMEDKKFYFYDVAFIDNNLNAILKYPIDDKKNYCHKDIKENTTYMICDTNTKVHIFNIIKYDGILKCQCKLILNDDKIYDAYLFMKENETCTLKECSDINSYTFIPFDSEEVDALSTNKLFSYVTGECRVSKVIIIKKDN